jgi:hypothetical protein
MGCGDTSSLGIVTISQGSHSSPFNKGYSVTSGPKKYNMIRLHSDDIKSSNVSLSLSPNNLIFLSNKSDKNISLIDLN